MNKKMVLTRARALVCLIFSVTALSAAEPRFSRHFGDGMVVQRDQPLTVKGFADKNAEVTVEFAGQASKGTADDAGLWQVTFEPMAANAKGQTLSVKSAGGDISLSDVLIGDVFLFARQTSVDISLGRDEAGRRAADKADPLFRALTIKTLPASEPRDDLASEATSGWLTVEKETAMTLSAAAYYLGRDLRANVNVPVGIIDLNMGPAFPISWLSREALEETEKLYGKSDVPGQLAYFDKILEADKNGEKRPKGAIAGDPAAYALFPSGGYNAVLSPLKGLAVKAALVQLGNDYPYMIYAELEDNGKILDRDELDRAYVETYNIRKVGFRMEPVTTPRVPREWRTLFAGGNVPMGLVVPPASALNTLGEHHREMRELQRQTAEELPGVDVILPGSENRLFSAQPTDEALLARRCSSWLLGAVYDRPDVPETGPMFDRLETHFNEATVFFKKGTAEGLKASGDALDYFEVAGVDSEYAPAKATIDGDVIRIKSETVPRIVHVRYNWNSHPDQGLVNTAGLPAMPFRSEKAPYHWFVTNADDDLPMEYFTPANEWEKNDVTLINGQLKTHGYDNFSGWLGPVGVKTGPFGPNMGVREVVSGSPADSKLFEGDVIYSANGAMLGWKAWEVMAAAITESETREKNGKLVLGVRRDGENRDVELTLEVMGTYSPTAPYDCPKTEKIIADLQNWVVAQGADAGFLNTDAIFLLATGDPEMQGYVRRVIYKIMAGMDPNKEINPVGGMKSWHSSANAFLFGEYYLATGDRNALPYLKWFCDRLAATQNKQEGGWRHNFPGGPTYGLIPNAGLPGVMGMQFAKEAGVDIDMDSFALGVQHFGRNRAETGFLIYGFGGCERDVPAPVNPEALATGHLDTYNGGLSAAGILMGLTGNHRAAHLCSLISSYAWNNTFHGHGGNFWNNFWTPLGAHAHSKAAFIHFWKNYRWYRECNRMFDGSLIQHESGKVGAGCGVALVAPRQRLQIVGAPVSPFTVDAPAYLKPALDAYWKKDYATCETLVNDLLAAGTVAKNERATVEYLARAAREIQESIVDDLARVSRLAAEGKPAEAKTFMPGLAGILPEGDARLAAAEKAIADAEGAVTSDAKKTAEKTEKLEEKRVWQCLVTEIETARSKAKGEFGPGKVAPEEANVWRMSVVEDISQAPKDWTKPRFDDAAWMETHLPISWRMYHTALLRTTFNVEDKKAFDGLRFRGWLFRQQGIEIYLNGELIGKVNNLEKKTGNVDAEFKESALKHLKKGENTLAVSTRHNWRWGMLSMTVYNDGFGFRLDARLAK
ncbi:MAG: DUF6288 domain-containing protein [Lentisphaeria bacterium]|nr:DUF6288 domain-containing protein [Lentisphaeria bacterium]